MHESEPGLGDGWPAVTTRTLATDPFARPPRSRFSGDRASPAVAVAVGGALGGSARYGVGEGLPNDSDGIPWSTLSVNVVGAFVLAVLLVLILDLWPPQRYLRPLLCTGFLGAFTTFSALTVETDRLVSHGSPGTAAAYLALTVVVGFAAAALGLTLGHRITRRAPRYAAHEEVA